MRRGTVVLTPFPFTDLTGAKVRPAVVISRTDRRGDDVILAFISSVRSQKLLPTDLPVDPAHPDFQATGLKRALCHQVRQVSHPPAQSDPGGTRRPLACIASRIGPTAETRPGRVMLGVPVGRARRPTSSRRWPGSRNVRNGLTRRGCWHRERQPYHSIPSTFPVNHITWREGQRLVRSDARNSLSVLTHTTGTTEEGQPEERGKGNRDQHHEADDGQGERYAGPIR